MKQEFYVYGMTCANCQKSVQQKLGSSPLVRSVAVDLESGKVELMGSEPLDKIQLEKILGPKYTVDTLVFSSSQNKLKQLYPLFLILSYVVLGSLFLIRENPSPQNFMYHYMGLFFVVFSFFKFLDYQGFPHSFAQYDPLAKRSQLYAYLYPFLETLLGIAFLFQYQLRAALWGTLILLSITTIGVVRSLVNQRHIACACLGTVLKLPMTEATLIENSIMLIMSISMLLYGF
ncbi:MAG: heavy-metal-associated domain-containing protein [Flavobacteriaceae bacterium]